MQLLQQSRKLNLNFFPSRASVALARSSHIVVLMNESYNAIAMSRFGESKVEKGQLRSPMSGQARKNIKQNKSKNHQSKNRTKTPKTTTNSKNRGEGPDQKSPRGRRMPLNWDLAKTNTKHQQKCKIIAKVSSKTLHSAAPKPRIPLPGSRRSRREALQAQDIFAIKTAESQI